MAFYFAEESKILDNYIKLGHPSCYVEYFMLWGRCMPSLIAMLLMYMYIIGVLNLITRASVGYHFNKHALHIGSSTLYTVCYLL